MKNANSQRGQSCSEKYTNDESGQRLPDILRYVQAKEKEEWVIQ